MDVVINVCKARTLAHRNETDRFKKFTYNEVVTHDKANLKTVWLKDKSLADTENLPPPTELAAEIVDSLEVALEEFRGVEDSLKHIEE
ncbi:MAG: methyltransferase [Verrucomicrobiales bacterium]|jgi:type I restriction enzyme M protein